MSNRLNIDASRYIHGGPGRWFLVGDAAEGQIFANKRDALVALSFHVQRYVDAAWKPNDLAALASPGGPPDV